MMRRMVLAALAAAILYPCVAQGAGSGLISQMDAQRHGLTRAWFTQIQVDRARARVANVVLHGDTLFVQTDRAMLHAVNAETGQTLWAVLVGNPDHPSLIPGVNQDLVSVVNGSNLFVLNRYNGKLLWKTQIEGAPGAGAAMSDRRAYVPTVAGLVYSYELEPAKDPMAELGVVRKKKLTPEEEAAERADRVDTLRLRQEYVPPMACQSLGRSLVQPLVTRQSPSQEYVAWPTDAGYLFVGLMDGREERFTIKYRLKTGAGIAAQPAYRPGDPQKVGDSGMIYCTSRDGYAHAIAEKDGSSAWQFSTGEPILQPPALIDDTLYVATQLGGMYSLNATSGAQNWWTPGASQFIAASPERVYAVDKIGQILVLDANTGSRLDTIANWHLPIKLLNTQTDRIYLVSETGLVQCLREIELAEPVRYGLDRVAGGKKEAIQQEGLPPAGEGAPAEKPEAKPEPADPNDPFAFPGKAAGPAGPAGPAAPADEEDPFK